jgi:hypothetical protein
MIIFLLLCYGFLSLSAMSYEAKPTPVSGLTRAMVHGFVSMKKIENGTTIADGLWKYYLPEDLTDQVPSKDNRHFKKRLNEIVDTLREAVDYDKSICLPKMWGSRHSGERYPLNYFTVEHVQDKFDEGFIRMRQWQILDSWVKFGGLPGETQE